MARLTSNKGFTLVEVCVVLAGMSVLAGLLLPCSQFDADSRYVWPQEYLLHQAEAMSEANEIEYSFENVPSIHFNENGNVNQARTIDLDGHPIVVELGGGRLVEKE